MTAIGITAVDTDIGKTVAGGALAAAISLRGIDLGVYKPAASGCIRREGGKLISTDVEFLLRAAGLPDNAHNSAVSCVFEDALSPAEAANIAGITIDSRLLVENGKKILAAHDISIVEGVGGIAAPLTPSYLVKDFFVDLGVPVIIVVKPVLGSVNHLALTAEYMKNYGIKTAGIIVNCWDEGRAGILERSNISYYEALTGLPILGKLPVLPPDVLRNRKELALAAEKNISIDKILARIRA
jgi:dethiobiotin synthetase